MSRGSESICTSVDFSDLARARFRVCGRVGALEGGLREGGEKERVVGFIRSP
jgi:hypothetical protein